MSIAYATHVTFTATLVERPLFRSEQRLDLVLGGVREGPNGRTRFYQPARALGSLAGRLGRLQAGEALIGYGTLIQEHDELAVLIEEVARLPHDGDRLFRDPRGGVLLEQGRLEITARGLLMRAPTTARLEDRTTPVTNVSLGLSPRREGKPLEGGLIPIELAAYGMLAHELGQLAAKRYVQVSGLLQRRVLAETRVQRIEILTLDGLHGERALLV